MSQTLRRAIGNKREQCFGGPTFIVPVRDYVIFFRKFEEPYPVGIDHVTNSLVPSLETVEPSPLYSPIVYIVSREISGDKSIEDYMKFFTLLKLRALDVLRLFGERDESFIRMLDYFQSLDSPCTIISIMLIQAEIKIKETSYVPLEYFSKVNYGHHYFLILNQNIDKKNINKITQIWKSDKEPEENILNCSCCYMIDFEENHENETIRGLWNAFTNHKTENNYKPIMGKLKKSFFYKDTNEEKILFELLIELKKTADESGIESTEEVRPHYDWFYDQRIKNAVKRFESASNDDEKIQHLLHLKALMETFVTQYYQYFKDKNICCPPGIEKKLIADVKTTRIFITNRHHADTTDIARVRTSTAHSMHSEIDNEQNNETSSIIEKENTSHKSSLVAKSETDSDKSHPSPILLPEQSLQETIEEWNKIITVNVEHQTTPLIITAHSRSTVKEQPSKTTTMDTENKINAPQEDFSVIAEEWNRITTVHVEHQTIPFKAEPTSLPVPREERDDKIIVNTEDQMNPLTSDNSPTLEEWNKNITIYTEHESIPFQAVPQPPPAVTEEWNKISIVYMEHQKIPLLIVPSPPTVTEEWNKIITVHTEYETIPLLIVPSPPVVTAEWDNNITVYMEHQKTPLIIVPSPPTVTAEWSNNTTHYTEHETLPFKADHPPSAITEEWNSKTVTSTECQTIPPTVVSTASTSQSQEFNILFLGETGVGKSTLISSLGNYLNWPTFEEAKKNQMQVCIPLQFKVQRKGEDNKIAETLITVGDPEDNENFNDIGQSVTQKPKVHEFTFQSNKIKVIDTPGLSDTRGAEQDKKNLELIRECIHNQKEIHAICIVLKSNDASLRPEFEQALRNFFSLFPKSALKNVFFFYTYASGSFFRIGNSTGPVKEMQKKIEDCHGATYAFEEANICAVDSESLKYLLCKERGVEYSNRLEEDLDFYWNESAAEVEGFFKFIKTVQPIKTKVILAIEHLATAALRLEELIRNSELTVEKKEELVNESKIFISAARKYSMVTEYHRLKTDVEHWTVEEFFESCENCERILKSMDSDFDQQIFTRFKEASNALRPQSLVVKKEEHIHHSQHINKESSPQVKKTEITPNYQPHQDVHKGDVDNLQISTCLSMQRRISAMETNQSTAIIESNNSVPSPSIPDTVGPTVKPEITPPPIHSLRTHLSTFIDSAIPEWDKNITIYTEHESIPFQAVPQPPPVVTEEWNKINTVYMEHETIPLLIVPSPPVVTVEWDKISTVYMEYQKIPLIIVPSPPAITAEWNKIITVHTEHETIPLIIIYYPPAITVEWDNIITEYNEHETLPFKPHPPAITAEWDKIVTIYTEYDTIPLLIIPSPPTVTKEWNKIITSYTEHETIPLIIIPSPPAVTAEWDNTITVYTEHDTMPFTVVPPSPPQEFTVIFLGESGVGKSTLISGLGNYLNWPTFEEAKKNQMEICIPVEFKVQRKLEEGGFDETTVRAGDFEDNENFNDIGQSVTQKPKVHEFTFQNNTVKVIDTPGLSDTRGAEQDKKNLELIRECIHNQKEIHAICIVLKSNESKLGNQFELAIRDLLSLFPKSALKNVFFFFTYARGTYFGIGDILNPLKELQQKFRDSHGVTFEFEGRNMCPVDSESFRYLLCKEQGIKYSSSAEERFEYCWNETAKQVLDFLAFLKSVDPVDVEKIKAAHELVKTALELEEFLRTDKTLRNGLSEGARELLRKKTEPLFYIAKDLTMVSEYYRLKTERNTFDFEEEMKFINGLLSIVRNSNVYDGLLNFMANLSLIQGNYNEINGKSSVISV